LAAQIEDLQARYLFALDFHDPTLYASTFTPDGVLDYGSEKASDYEYRDQSRREQGDVEVFMVPCRE